MWLENTDFKKNKLCLVMKHRDKLWKNVLLSLYLKKFIKIKHSM